MSYSFNGSSSYLYRNSCPWDGTFPVTISAWAKSASPAGNQAVVQLGGSGSGNYAEISTTSLNRWAGVAYTNAIFRTQSASTPSTGTWEHLMYVLVTGQLGYFYIDGVLDGTGVRPTAIAAATTPDRVSIGARVVASTGAYYPGQVAEVGVWNAALDVNAAIALAAGVPPVLVVPQSLLLYAPLMGNALAVMDGTFFSAGGLPVALDDHPAMVRPCGMSFQ